LVNCLLFTDVSVNPKQRLGVGACLLLPLQFPDSPGHEIDWAELSRQLHCRRFTDTSSTMLELQTVLWGLEIYRAQVPSSLRGGLQLYTDSQCVAGLSLRRERLEATAYRAGRSGRLLANAHLYGEFYAASDELGFQIAKVAGHSRLSSQDSLERIFSLVDRGARRELKLWTAAPEA